MKRRFGIWTATRMRFSHSVNEAGLAAPPIPLFEIILTTDLGVPLNGYTVVEDFATSALQLPDGDISQMRFTFEASSVEGLTITEAYVGHGASVGDVYDFASAPVQILFDGSASVIIGTGLSVVSDYANFAYDKTSNLLVAMYLNGGTSSDCPKIIPTASGVASYRKSANEASTVDKTGYAASDVLYAINKIETDAN